MSIYLLNIPVVKTVTNDDNVLIFRSEDSFFRKYDK